MMKIKSIIIFLFLFPRMYSQIDLINTGTDAELLLPTILDKNILVNGVQNYLVKSYDECDNLSSLTVPGPSGYSGFIWRNDTVTSYFLSTSMAAYNSKIYKSVDGNTTWTLKLDTQNYHVNCYIFFDTLEGVAMGGFGKCIRTKDGGNTWTGGSNPLTIVTAIKAYGDSMLCIGGGTSGSGDFVISKDRGNTWFSGHSFIGITGGNPSPTDFFFLNKDTIFGVAISGFDGAPFAKSFNGGKNWQFNIIAPYKYNENLYGLCARSKNEIYAVGVTSGTIGIILKSTDLGQSWSGFNTGIKSVLYNMRFLNDSIALVSGSDGVLFKWNSKQTVFTGINEHEKNTLAATLFPNPVKDKLNVRSSELRYTTLHCTISNVMGEIVFMKDLQSTEPEVNLDVSVLSQGIYFVKLKQDNKQGLYKFIKE